MLPSGYTTNFYTTNCEEQCPNITQPNSYYIFGTKTEQNIFFLHHTITGKGIAYIRPCNLLLPWRPVEIEFENNRCCLEVYNTSDSTVEFQYGHEVAYFDARSKGLVQINNSKHFLIDQYLHNRVTPAILSPKPLAYD